MTPFDPGHRRRRRQWQRQRKDHRKKAMVGSSIHDIPDDMLMQILLRLNSPLWLVRAACVCKRWRHVITSGGAGANEGRTFLRLTRSLHSPTIIGQYHNHTNDGHHCFLPFSSRIAPSRFAIDKVSILADCRGGLVLLQSRYGPCARSVPNLAVYDPLSWKRWSISRPCPPNKKEYCYFVTDVFLLDGDDGNISISNFRVLCTLDADEADPQACIFSTANGGEWDWLWVLPEETYRQTQSRRDIFSYTLPWPQFLRACPC